MFNRRTLAALTAVAALAGGAAGAGAADASPPPTKSLGKMTDSQRIKNTHSIAIQLNTIIRDMNTRLVAVEAQLAATHKLVEEGNTLALGLHQRLRTSTGYSLPLLIEQIHSKVYNEL